jgi:hypothetical protein
LLEEQESQARMSYELSLIDRNTPIETEVPLAIVPLFGVPCIWIPHHPYEHHDTIEKINKSRSYSQLVEWTKNILYYIG